MKILISAVILFSSSCSVLQIKRPESKIVEEKNNINLEKCTSSYLLPAIDTALISGAGFAYGYLGLIPFAGSALYGYYNVYLCRKTAINNSQIK